MSETKKPLPVAFVFGNEHRLKGLFSDPEIKSAFYSTTIVHPERYLQPFPSRWEWDDATCVILTRLYAWDKRSIPTNVTSLGREAMLRNGLVILHFDFESDARNYGIILVPIFKMNL